MPVNTLLLFDVDGVLVHPRGYKEALREAVDAFADWMGLPPVGLTDDEIAVFESYSVTNEWDIMPLCIGAMLAPMLSEHPELIRETVMETLAALRGAALTIDRPDFAALAGEAHSLTPDGSPPTKAIHRLLRARTLEAAHPLLAEMLDDIYSTDSPTTFIFQHYVLGSQHFEETYGIPAAFEAESTLLQHDHPLLSKELRCHLLDLLADGSALHASIYTARPSHPPADLPPEQRDPHGYPPEGDLAAELLELDGRLPLIAGGRIWWLARQHNRHASEYLKPSPVQALAAIGAALSGEETKALLAAARFAEHGELTGPLAAIDGPTRVVVFEDSPGGVKAVRRAVALLQDAGLHVTAEAVGVAPEPSKREALAQVCDRVVYDINEGLAPYLV